MGRLIDVSLTVRPGMLVWPGDDGVDLRRVARMEEGAEYNLSRIACGVHVGTHVDAPFHFIRDGATAEQLSVEVLVGPAWTADLGRTRRIAAADLDAVGVPDGTTRLLLKTINSTYVGSDTAFHEDFAGLTESGAAWVLGRGIRLIGIDYLSASCLDQTGPVHRSLLGSGVVLVEGLVLEKVPPGPCRLYCLPLKLKGSDGAMARAVVEIG